MKTRFNAVGITLDPTEILAMTDEKVLSFLKGFNKSPLLKAFVIAHEGEASPHVDNYQGSPVLKFTRNIIQTMFQKIKSGLPVFSKHYENDFEEEGREEVAYIVGKGLKEIAGKMHAVAVAFFPKEKESVGELAESVSIEAELDIENNGYVSNIHDMSGIALVPSGDEPAFKGAKQIGKVRASMKTDGILDWHTIEAEFKRMKGLPSQVSDPVEMIGNLDFNQDGKPILSGVDKKYTSHVERLVQSAIEKERSKSNPDFDRIKRERDEFMKKLSVYEAKPKLLEAAKNAKLGDGFVKYIESRVDRFKSSDNIDEAIKEFIEDKKIDYSDIVKSSGVDVSLPAGQSSTDEINYDDPEQNPFLKD